MFVHRIVFTALLFVLFLVRVHSQEGCAHVVGASAQQSSTADETWTISATVSSTETGWDKYADEWQVRAGEQVLGTRILAHPHVNEQPFTRSLPNVVIPEDVTQVVIAARDSVLGYCGDEFTLELPRDSVTPPPVPQTLPPEPTNANSATPESSLAPSSIAGADPETSEPTTGTSLSPSSMASDESLETDSLMDGATSSAFASKRVSFCILLSFAIVLQSMT